MNSNSAKRRSRHVPLACLGAALLFALAAQAAEIHDAARTGDLARVRALLDANPNLVNARTPNGWTPLLQACGRPNNLEMARLLVERGADLQAASTYGGTALDLAYDSGDDALFRFLQEKGARLTPAELRNDAVAGRVRRIAFGWGMRNNVAVSAGPDGLLIVDSGFGRRSAEALRKELEKAGGTLKFIVNSHNHGDHAAGNFLAGPDTRLLDFAGLNRAAEEGVLTRVQKPLAGPAGKSFPEHYSLRFNGEEIRFIPRPGMHSGRDLLVHFAGSGVVFMGDLLLSQNGPALSQVPEYMEFLDAALDVFPAGTVFISGHGRDLDAAGLRRYRDDLQKMIDIVRAEAAGGKSLERMLQEDVLKAFKADYSFLDWLGPDTWMRSAYRRLVLKPAAAVLERTLREKGVEAAMAEFRKGVLGNKEYDLDEQELNALGYRLWRQERKTAEAVAVFTLNTEAFPDAWNTWDSLGEALWWGKDDKERAEACYEKSLSLNPHSRSGRNALSQIRGYKLDREGETRTASGFGPGAPTGLQGPYLGQEPPGLTPKVFAPGIVATAGAFEFSQAFSPDGREFYFTRRLEPDGRNTILVCRLEADGWRAPVEAEFAKGFPSNEPHVTPDGRKVYFGSVRPRSEGAAPEYGIWVAERGKKGWDAPRYHGPGMFVSTERNGDLYLNDITRSAGGGIVRYPFLAGAFGKAERLGGGVNSPEEGAHAWVSADGEYIVFDAYQREGGQGGEGDLYVCFRQADGSWGEARNLGDEVNNPGTNFCPSLSPDGKYLFFSTRRDIYWVSTGVIERFRPQK